MKESRFQGRGHVSGGSNSSCTGSKCAGWRVDDKIHYRCGPGKVGAAGVQPVSYVQRIEEGALFMYQVVGR